MKSLLIAAMIAFAAASSATVPAQAASVVVSSDNGVVRVRDHHRHNDWRHDRDWRRHHWRRHHHRHYRPHCRVKVVKHWRHHRLVIRKVRVCR